MSLRIALAAAATTVLSVTAVQAQPITFALDPTHTFVNFEAKHFGTSTNRGRFDKKSGTIVIDPVAKTGQIEINIDMASISTGTPSFDGHLKSKDFFNAEAFPTATFKSTKIKFDGDKIDEVEGTLTMLGKTVPVKLDAEHYGCFDHPRLKRQVCGGDFETTIKRSDFGMTYGLPVIPDNIKLEIQVEGVRQ
jgi:polyisoprenoid-binding protein YceI